MKSKTERTGAPTWLGVIIVFLILGLVCCFCIFILPALVPSGGAAANSPAGAAGGGVAPPPGQPLGSPAAGNNAANRPPTPGEGHVPHYWKHQNLSAEFSESMHVPHGFEKQLQVLLDKTWRDKATRDRRDDGMGMPTGLQLVQATRIEDRDMWCRYLAGRERLREKRPKGVKGVNELDGKNESGFVRTQEVLSDDTAERLESEALNEYYLWHGTSVQGALGITKTGFRLSFVGSNAGTMFGRGAYFAEMCSKSDEYSSTDETNPLYKGMYALLLCRVCCGEMFRVVRSDIPAIENALKTGSYDSVLGDREASVGTYREYVVFAEDLIYPEYVVVYKRLFQNEEE